MRNGLLGSIAALVAGASLAFGQAPAQPTPLGPSTPPGVAFAQSATPEPVPLGPSVLGITPITPPEPNAFMPGPEGYPGGPGGPGGPSAERGSIQGDYLLWWIRTFGPIYPLVSVGTTGPRGALGPGTATIVGPGKFENNPFSGGRWDIDYWLPRNRRIGGEFSGFVLGLRSQTITYNAKFKIWCDNTKELTLLTGFRYMDLSERMDIQQRTTLLPGNTVSFYGLLFAAPAEIDVADTFQTRNQYYFHQIGLQGEWHYKCWTSTGSVKFNYGVDHETEVVNGNSTLIISPGTPAAIATTVPGGLLALSSNIGRRHKDVFTVMPELRYQLSYRLVRNVDLLMGYQIAYLSRSIRPGQQFSPAISPTLLPTSAFFSAPGGAFAPAPVFNQTDWWVQGVNFGVNVHF